MKKHIFTLQFFIIISFMYGQMPDTDIFLYEIKNTGKTVIVHKGENITNKVGYDNQPFFLPDNKTIFFISAKEDKQTDVYKYNIRNKKITQVTSTTQSEYSPSITPDGKNISVVMVEKDSTQRIWLVKPDGSSSSVLIENEDSIGYYTWLNTDSLLYYKVGGPQALHAYCLSKNKDILIAKNVTRSFKKCDKNTFFYVIKENDKNTVRIYNTQLKKSIEYATTKKEIEDFIWDKYLGLVKADGSKLMRYHTEIKSWLELADFSSAGIKKITRIAFSPNGRYLAIVSQK